MQGSGGFLSAHSSCVSSSLSIRVKNKSSHRSGRNRIDAEHRVFRATSDVKDSEGNVIVTAYDLVGPCISSTLVGKSITTRSPAHRSLIRPVAQHSQAMASEFCWSPPLRQPCELQSTETVFTTTRKMRMRASESTRISEDNQRN